jgi:hypothetical protein
MSAIHDGSDPSIGKSATTESKSLIRQKPSQGGWLRKLSVRWSRSWIKRTLSFRSTTRMHARLANQLHELRLETNSALRTTLLHETDSPEIKLLHESLEDFAKAHKEQTGSAASSQYLRQARHALKFILQQAPPQLIESLNTFGDREIDLTAYEIPFKGTYKAALMKYAVDLTSLRKINIASLKANKTQDISSSVSFLKLNTMLIASIFSLVDDNKVIVPIQNFLTRLPEKIAVVRNTQKNSDTLAEPFVTSAAEIPIHTKHKLVRTPERSLVLSAQGLSTLGFMEKRWQGLAIPADHDEPFDLTAYRTVSIRNADMTTRSANIHIHLPGITYKQCTLLFQVIEQACAADTEKRKDSDKLTRLELFEQFVTKNPWAETFRENIFQFIDDSESVICAASFDLGADDTNPMGSIIREKDEYITLSDSQTIEHCVAYARLGSLERDTSGGLSLLPSDIDVPEGLGASFRGDPVISQSIHEHCLTLKETGDTSEFSITLPPLMTEKGEAKLTCQLQRNENNSITIKYEWEEGGKKIQREMTYPSIKLELTLLSYEEFVQHLFDQGMFTADVLLTKSDFLLVNA